VYQVTAVVVDMVDIAVAADTQVVGMLVVVAAAVINKLAAAAAMMVTNTLSLKCLY
jgi:hypothetical protein